MTFIIAIIDMKRGNKFYNRQFCVEGSWYEPAKVLTREYKSIVDAWYYDTTSSSGDWSGWFIQKIGKTFILVPFSQELCGNCCYSVSAGIGMYFGKSIDECKDAAKSIEIYNLSC